MADFQHVNGHWKFKKFIDHTFITKMSMYR